MKTSKIFGLSIAPASSIPYSFARKQCTTTSVHKYNFPVSERTLIDHSIFIMHPQRWIIVWNNNNLIKQCQPKYYVKAFSLSQMSKKIIK
ncbi:MAG TPA: hypothetical protein VGP55_11810 [Chitinophagaceae bacterium]|nr:hypothetical protein [Chitinophagaceae bacterium]